MRLWRFLFPRDLVLCVFSWLPGYQFPAMPRALQESWQSSWDLLEFSSCPFNLWMSTGPWLKGCAHTAHVGVWRSSNTSAPSKCRGASQGAFLQHQAVHLPLFSLDLKPFSLPSELPSAGKGGFLRSAPRTAKSWFGKVLIQGGLHLAMSNMHLLDLEWLEKGVNQVL